MTAVISYSCQDDPKAWAGVHVVTWTPTSRCSQRAEAVHEQRGLGNGDRQDLVEVADPQDRSVASLQAEEAW